MMISRVPNGPASSAIGKDIVYSDSLPRVVVAGSKASSATGDEVIKWLGSERAWIESELRCHGAVLFRGFKGLCTAEDFEAVVSRISDRLLDYTGGHTPRSAVAGKVVTSTDAPCHITIGQHQEMSYLEPTPEIPDPTPDKVAFFCQVVPGSGGQTPLCDMRQVYNRLPADLISRFETKGIRLTRRLPETMEAGYEATWPGVLGSRDRGKAESFVAGRGWRVEWKDDGGATVYHQPSPVTKYHAVTGEKVWFNQAHLLHKAFAPWTGDFLGPSPQQKAEADRLRPHLSQRFYFHTTHADGTEILLDDLICIRQTISDCTVTFDWQVSDLLVCDNKLVSHGRRPYEPPRKILAALAADNC